MVYQSNKEEKRGKGRPKLLKNKMKDDIRKDVKSLESSVSKGIESKSKINIQNQKLSKMKAEGHVVSKGRVFGSRNQVQRDIDILIQANGIAVFDKILELALAGSESHLHFLARRAHPYTMKTFITLPEKDLLTLQDVSEASKQAMNLVAQGDLSIEDAKIMNEILELRAKMIQSETIEPKVEELMRLTGLHKK